jgi:transposase
MSEGSKEAVRADDQVVAASELRRLEERVRELEWLLGRKTMEVEILKEALDLARAKKPILLSHSPVRAISGEDRQHHARRGALECRRAPPGQEIPTRRAGTGR